MPRAGRRPSGPDPRAFQAPGGVTVLLQHGPRDVHTLRSKRGARLRQLRFRLRHVQYHLGRQGTPTRGPLAPGPRHRGE
eukprot:3111248-Alexandrium_andersonii.AAC.1